MTLTSEQWEKVDDKYSKLMYKICYRISGDNAISSFDDNLQDMRLAAMEAVIGFEKQNEGANGKFDDFWGTKGFDQYIKTCLWTKKNNKGAKITKKWPITKGTVSTDKEEVLNLEDASASPYDTLFIEEFSEMLDGQQKEVINFVVQDPTLIKTSGKFNIARLSEKMGISMFKTKNIVEKLANYLENDL
tara:strand:+ start:9344 stop:9910 length:567 start_codon:yes stop_codon:yes gene_type:complete